MFKLIHIKDTGSFGFPDITISEQAETPSLEQLQTAVDGMIEIVPYFNRYDGELCVAFCNEEGKLERREVNEVATSAWWTALGGPCDDMLVGDVLIVCGSKEELSRL